MMDYTAGQSRAQGGTLSNEPGAVSSVNSSRLRTQTAGGGLSMNISTGGPHVLLFERDQQFAVLLGSELQLAGYECHTARTAVEVFDAIARYSIRLVLVNLAQAAAARREFWVALDTQRRGRGVQVLTFHCSNLAGYGPLSDDPDDRSHIMLADLEVDGMQGIVHMVNAIRSRIAVSNNGSLSRPVSNAGTDFRQQNVTGTGEGGKVSQSTMPLPTAPINNGVSYSGRNAPTPPPSVSNPPVPPSFSPAVEASSPPRASTVNHTDKIRAVIYPNQRSWSTQRDSDSSNNLNSATSQNNQNSAPVNAAPPLSPSSERQARSEGTSWQPQIQTEQKESGLAQLSRMVQERRAPLADTAIATGNGQDAAPLSEATMPQQRVRPSEATAISVQPLRASPIEDLPTDRITNNSRNAHTASNGTASRPDSSAQGNPYQNNQPYQSASTLASIAMPVSHSSVADMPVAEPATTVSPPEQSEPDLAPPQPLTNDSRTEAQSVRDEATFSTGEVQQQQRTGGRQSQEQRLAEQLQSMLQEQTQQQPAETEKQKSANSGGNPLLNLMPVQSQQRSEAVALNPATDNALLFDIVQSLPPMSSPPPQQMLSGRATRSLGNVLLEGHLVPQDRLEVALGIQRMLRGVDMNYQLGEILLMFKLLTPDQLLAASLVSYGLITTTQISALGRIRQELHSIGLEYDLENLLILFRILTSEQLREVRSSWS
ncbi:MAG TPA: hypothetical protein VKU38_01695 [Ktedonobacteraceae bacterium]|nr:hypothetical protein [Ktedonobacteraceae bacterium]